MRHSRRGNTLHGRTSPHSCMCSGDDFQCSEPTASPSPSTLTCVPMAYRVSFTAYCSQRLRIEDQFSGVELDGNGDSAGTTTNGDLGKMPTSGSRLNVRHHLASWRTQNVFLCIRIVIIRMFKRKRKRMNGRRINVGPPLSRLAHNLCKHRSTRFKWNSLS